MSETAWRRRVLRIASQSRTRRRGAFPHTRPVRPLPTSRLPGPPKAGIVYVHLSGTEYQETEAHECPDYGRRGFHRISPGRGAPADGPQRGRRGRPVHGEPGEHPAPGRRRQVPVRPRVGPQRLDHDGGRGPLRCDLPPGRRRRRAAHRGQARPHDRDQHPRLGGRAGPRQQVRPEGLHRLDERGVRQEHQGALQRVGRHDAWLDALLAMELCVQQDGGRVPGVGVQRSVRPADGGVQALQHRRAAADGPVRHGGPPVHPVGPGRRDHRDLRHGQAEPLLLQCRRRG